MGDPGGTIIDDHTRAYVNHRGPRRKGVNMDVICSSLSLMAASLLALVRGVAISLCKQLFCGKVEYLLSEDYCPWHRASRSLWEASLYLCVAELCLLALRRPKRWFLSAEDSSIMPCTACGCMECEVGGDRD